MPSRRPSALPPAGAALAALVATALATPPAATAGDGTWTGTGPFPPGDGSREIDALALDPATGTLYAGTGSGTVFQRSDPAFSQPPVAQDDQVVLVPVAPVDIPVLANDTDPEGALDPATVTIEDAPAHGTATVDPDGAVHYAPGPGFGTGDGFTYTVRDAAGATSNPATVDVVKPELALSPLALDFPRASTAPQEVTLSSSGTFELEITGIDPPPEPFAVAGGDCLPLPRTLPPGESCTLEVAFAPQGPGVFRGAVFLDHSGALDPLELPVIGRAEVLEIPTAGVWGLVALGLFLALLGARRLAG